MTEDNFTNLNELNTVKTIEWKNCILFDDIKYINIDFNTFNSRNDNGYNGEQHTTASVNIYERIPDESKLKVPNVILNGSLTTVLIYLETNNIEELEFKQTSFDETIQHVWDATFERIKVS